MDVAGLPIECPATASSPKVLDLTQLTGVITVASDDAIAMARRLSPEEGIFCGISSDCNVVATLKVARAQPPVSQGVVSLGALGLIGGDDVCGPGLLSPDLVHLMIEACRLAFEDRDRFLGDLRRALVSVAPFLDRERARIRRAAIDPSDTPGHRLTPGGQWEQRAGGAQVIRIDRAEACLHGEADLRREGCAVG